MRNKLSRLIISSLCVISLLFNSFIPFLSTQVAYATEDATPSAEVVVDPSPTSTPTPEVTPASEASPTPSTSPSATPTPTPTPTQSPSPWTFEKVELNKEYVDPQNNGVKLTFTKLPTPAGNIKIEEITLTQEQIQQTGSLSNKAYDITSDMADGSFTYNLSLPIPESSKGKEVSVKFAEELANIDSAAKVENTLTKTDTSISVTSLDHFTIFVVTSPVQTGVVGECTVEVTGADPATDKCYNTIQAAIGGASSGNIINVAAGTYTENLTIDKSLSLIGVDDTTHIIGAIESTGDNVTIQSLKITNSNPDGPYDWGVKATAGKALTLENVTVDVSHNGVYMRSVSMIATTVTINNSRIKGFDAIYLFDPALSTTVTNADVNITVNNTSLLGRTSYSGLYDDMGVVGTDYVDNVHINFTGSSSVANEYTGGATSKERLIWFYYAGNNSVTGTPNYTNHTNSAVNANALFVSTLGYTNTVQGQTVGRYADDSAQFETALASDSTTPIMFGTDIATTKDNTLNTGVKLIIEHNYSLTNTGHTLTNNGTILIESGATLTAGTIDGNGTIELCVNTGGTVGCFSSIQTAINAAPSDAIINVAAGDYTENITINKSLTLIGMGDTTHIIGNINATGADVTIQSLKITNSNVPGYGVKATAGKALTLNNVTVDVVHDGISMYDVSMTATTININNSDIRGYAAIYLYDPANSLIDTNADVNINVNNTSLIGVANDDGSGGNDFAVIGTDYVDDVHVMFDSASSVANEYTVGAQAKEFLVWFYNAGNNSVTGSPTYTNGANSKVNENALFVSSLNYTNTVAGKTVARYVSNTTEFEAALASASTTPIVVGRGDDAITTTAGTKTLNAGTTLLIETNNAPTTIAEGTTLVNNGAIIIETGATFINNGTIAITVTANTQSKERGTADPVLTYTGASSLVNGDTFTGSLTRTAGEAIGTYPITQGTLSAGTHYVITYIGANLTISDTITPTIPSYTVSETIISPNNDGTKDSSNIDVAYSEQVNADINILDNLGVKVRDLYSASNVTNPNAQVWNGKNNSNVVVTDGVYTIQVIGTDSAGLTVTNTSRTITVDNTVPLITVSGLLPGYILPTINIANASSYTLNGTYTELGSMGRFTWDAWKVLPGPVLAAIGSTVYESSTAGTGTDVPWSHTWTNFSTDLAGLEGTFRIWSDVYDTANNRGYTSNDGTYDLVAPTATVAYNITAPTNGSVVATITPSETVTGALTHTFTDNGSFTFNFTDLAGNPGSAVATVSNIDTVAPVIALHDKITVEATSSLGAVVTYTAPDATDNMDATAPATCSSSPASGSTFPIGITTVTCNKTDTAGNVAISTTFQIKVEDTTAPTTPTATPIAGDYDSNQSVTLESTDSVSGPVAIYYTLNGTTPDNVTGTPYAGAITVDHDMTIEAIAYDNADHANASGVLTAVYGIAPVISGETSSSVSGNSITITWSTDDLSTSRVIYGTDSVSDATVATFLDGSNYGYANSTVEADNDPKVISHLVGLTGLTAGTTYYYRTVSHGSPETVSSEHTFATSTTTSSSGSGGSSGGDGLSDGLGCANHDCSVHTVATVATAAAPQSLAFASATFTASSAEEVLGASTDETKILESTPSALGVEFTPTPTPTGEVKGTETGGTNYWWLLFFGAGGLAVVYWFFKRKTSEGV